MNYLKSILYINILLIKLSICQHQDIDPAYLRQYYQQIAAQTGGNPADATPIYEQNPEQRQQYVQQQSGQQIRIKDNVQAQIKQQETQAYVAPTVREYLHNQPQVQYVSQPQAYKPQPSPQPKQQYRPRPSEYQQSGGKSSKLSQEEAEDYDPSPSYQFGFNVKDDEFTNYQNREESRDGNVIKGSYSVVDSDGFIRTVKYTADPKEGFKAEVIREPTDIVVKIPTQAPQQHSQHLQQQQPQHLKPQYQQYHQ